jgi:hypothetical protein
MLAQLSGRVMSDEFDALLATTELEREKADGIRSLIAAAKLAAGYQHRAEKAEGALAVALATLARASALTWEWRLTFPVVGTHWEGCHTVHVDCFNIRLRQTIDGKS